MDQWIIHKRKLTRLLASVLMLPFLIQPSGADERARGYARENPGRWHDADIRHFHEHDMVVWRSGHWQHGRHAGRLGWWWVVGGVWYFYPAAVRPYQDPYLPPLVEAPPPGASATQKYWYYCRNPQGYYPYVPSCSAGWEPVPANAPPPR